MPVNCPHCSQEIVDFLPKSRFDEKAEALKKAQEQLLAYGPKVAGYDQLAAQLAQAQKELETTKASTARQLAAAKAGFGDEALPFLGLAFDQAAAAAKAEGKDIDYAEFLSGKAKEHPALKGFLGGAGQGQGQGQERGAGAAGAGAAAAGSRIDQGAAAAGRGQGKMTPQQLQAHLASAEFRGLPPEKQRERMAELRREYAG